MKWTEYFVVTLALAACDPAVSEGEEGGTSGGADTTSSGSSPTPTTTPPGESSSSTTAATSEDDAGSSSAADGSASTTFAESSSTTDEGSSSTGDPFGGPCDAYEQDCPEGQKCNAWADDGGPSWNALGCFPVVDEPGQPGEACTVEFNAASGFDSCDVGSICWDIDGSTGEGVCTSMCQGSPEMPACEQDGTSCTISNGGVLNLCLPGCNPLEQDCSPGQACYFVGGSFTCAPDASGGSEPGDPCGAVNTCEAGQSCINATAYGPGCPEGAIACCSPMCDIFVGGCPEETQECLPWFTEGTAPPGLDDAGVCAVFE